MTEQTTRTALERDAELSLLVFRLDIVEADIRKLAGTLSLLIGREVTRTDAERQRCLDILRQYGGADFREIEDAIRKAA